MTYTDHFGVPPARSLHELLWDVSFHAMKDIVTMDELVKTRGTNLAVTPTPMDEEISTINLVRRLALLGRRLGVTAVLHSRSLEGKYTQAVPGQRTAPSGADLELNVEIAPGRWLDLLLQAKRLYPRQRVASRYDEWKQQQTANMVAWAATHGHRIPGLLLFNGLCQPFTKKKAPVSFGDFHCSAFGACSGANHLQLHNHTTMTAKGWSLFDGTPGGVSLVLDAILLATASAPRAPDLKSVHFPLEHLAHRGCGSAGIPAGPQGGGPRGIGPGGGSPSGTGLGGESNQGSPGRDGPGQDGPDGTDPDLSGAPTFDPAFLADEVPVVRSEAAPWARRLELLSAEGNVEEYRNQRDEEEFPIGASVVIRHPALQDLPKEAWSHGIAPGIRDIDKSARSVQSGERRRPGHRE